MGPKVLSSDYCNHDIRLVLEMKVTMYYCTCIEYCICILSVIFSNVLSCCQGLPGPPGPPGEGGKPGDQVSLLFLLNTVDKQESATMLSGSFVHHCQ